MNIFDQFGIKEVADVTLYSIHRKQDGSGDNYFVPALFFDTLKISSFDKAAENVWAEGGYGNERLISWDHSKNINVSLTDALCTPASLDLCWGGIFGADWKDGHIQIDSQIGYSCDIDRIDRIEKAFYPRNDKKNGTVSKLLPHIIEDEDLGDFNLLRTSSIVDGTVVEGSGYVRNHSYNWKLAIESAVNSVAQVPDRFFDVNGRSYPIDINRKVSVNSLPDYENYKDAIIYKINSKTKKAPPLAKIIFDYAVENKGRLVIKSLAATGLTASTITLAKLLELNDYIIHVDGILEKEDNNEINYYYPMRNLMTEIPYSSKTNNVFDYSIDERLYQILDEEIISSIIPETISAAALINQKVNYAENHSMTDLCEERGNLALDHFGSVEEVQIQIDICKGDYLAIIVDNENNYHALIGVYAERNQNEPKDTVVWCKPSVPVDVSQFKGLDMWLRFSGLNELIYFLITKYTQDIAAITSVYVNANEGEETWAVDDKKTTLDNQKNNGKLWAYINPKTMTPYSDDYWFHQGETFLVKSLTLAAPAQNKLKAKCINVKAGVWPGMYMLVGETWIRNKDTGKDERMQIRIPFCKVKSNNTISLESDGEPTTFNLELEVANSKTGNLIEITTYETATRLKCGENGNWYAVDGSSEVLYE